MYSDRCLSISPCTDRETYTRTIDSGFLFPWIAGALSTSLTGAGISHPKKAAKLNGRSVTTQRHKKYYYASPSRRTRTPWDPKPIPPRIRERPDPGEPSLRLVAMKVSDGFGNRILDWSTKDLTSWFPAQPLRTYAVLKNYLHSLQVWVCLCRRCSH